MTGAVRKGPRRARYVDLFSPTRGRVWGEGAETGAAKAPRLQAGVGREGTVQDATRSMGKARAAHDAAAELLVQMFALVASAEPEGRSGLAPLLAQAQAEYDATQAALSEARARVRRRA